MERKGGDRARVATFIVLALTPDDAADASLTAGWKRQSSFIGAHSTVTRRGRERRPDRSLGREQPRRQAIFAESRRRRRRPAAYDFAVAIGGSVAGSLVSGMTARAASSLIASMMNAA